MPLSTKPMEHRLYSQTWNIFTGTIVTYAPDLVDLSRFWRRQSFLVNSFRAVSYPPTLGLRGPST